MSSELSVTIKDSEKSLTKKYLQYEIYAVHEEDFVIKNAIQETLANFDGEPENIIVKIKMEIQ
ncbi:MAG TPA: hypothetical protein VHZ50_16325 [Puia sp.]|jgi:hypothetical protein|nr:hypothetical protein [Puia sp.]